MTAGVKRDGANARLLDETRVEHAKARVAVTLGKRRHDAVADQMQIQVGRRRRRVVAFDFGVDQDGGGFAHHLRW